MEGQPVSILQYVLTLFMSDGSQHLDRSRLHRVLRLVLVPRLPVHMFVILCVHDLDLAEQSKDQHNFRRKSRTLLARLLAKGIA